MEDRLDRSSIGWLTKPNVHACTAPRSKGRGNWLLKPARIADGQIRFSARWKVRFADGGAWIDFDRCASTYGMGGFGPFDLLSHVWPNLSTSIKRIDALIYRGDVLAGDGFSKATAQITKGEILKPVTGITGTFGRLSVVCMMVGSTRQVVSLTAVHVPHVHMQAT